METFREATPELLEAILNIMYHRGLKASTMDFVASSLGISKRTLYEFFASKSEMLSQALAYDRMRQSRKHSSIIANEPNVMQAMITIFLDFRDQMANIDLVFFRDMDECFPELRQAVRNVESKHQQILLDFFRRGIDEGVLRPDVNVVASWLLIQIQFESLKRMEKHFPPGITFLEAFDSIALGFMRSIASEKGMKMLDSITHRFNTVLIAAESNLKQKNEN